MPDPAEPGNNEWIEEEKRLKESGLYLELSRRGFIQTAGLVSLGVIAGISEPAFSHGIADELSKVITLKVNGESRALNIDSRTSLLDALREQLELTGTKKGCDHGQCGACTVLVNGRRVNSCLTLALAAEGADITTIEGLAKIPDPKTKDDLHPVQRAFLDNDAYQCGYCTPGQICSAVGALEEQKRGCLSIVSFHTGKTDRPELTDDEIRERMSGNICRCGAYHNIVAALRSVSNGASA